MTIRECYNELGGDYAEVKNRLCRDKLIQRLIAKFPNDDSYCRLCRAIKEGNREEAFLAAHTLKGVSANLGFARLLDSADKLTELLRSSPYCIPDEADLLMENVMGDYELTVAAIGRYVCSTSVKA